MKPLVYDACALIAFVRKEPNWAAVEAHLKAPDTLSLVHSLILCEFYYLTMQKSSQADADAALSDLDALGLVIRIDQDTPLLKEAARYKNAYNRRLSLADCHAMALANRLGAELLTCAHNDFDDIAQKGHCKVNFFR